MDDIICVCCKKYLINAFIKLGKQTDSKVIKDCNGSKADTELNVKYFVLGTNKNNL